MGKKAKKIKKNIMNIQAEGRGTAAGDAAKNQQMEIVKAKIAQLKADEQYEDALQEIIALFETGCVNVELLSATAEIYYLVGDYERAIMWAGKVISFDADNKAARLLLAKLYALQDELNQCFESLEKLLERNIEVSKAEKAEIEDLLDYFFADYEESDLQNDYPCLWKFSQDKMNSIVEGSEETVAVEARQRDTSEAGAVSAGKPEDEPFACLKGKTVDEIIAAIMGKSISLVEKVETCLYFAVYYYSQKDVAKTLMLLKQAFLIDGANDLVLKNIGFVLAEMGDKQGALEFLLKVKEKDLMVLHQIGLLG